MRLFIMIVIYFFRWSKQYYISNHPLDNVKLNLILKKKTLFFKKKHSNKILISKRFAILLRKGKAFSIKSLLHNKRTSYTNLNGNFFFKKFFFKSLLRGRQLLKPLLSLKDKTRQKKITKKVHTYNTCKLNLAHLLLRSHFFFFYSMLLMQLSQGIFT